MGGPVYIICDITNYLQSIAVQYAAYMSVMWKLEASSAQTLRIEYSLSLYSEVGGMLCSAVKYL